MTHDPRTFLFGTIAGVVITVGSLILVSEIAGIKWQPVRYPTADQRYGCTAAQQAPSGECK